jgi:hypothetical protein
MTDRADELEQEVLEMLLAGTDPVLETLRQQLKLSAHKPREMAATARKIPDTLFSRCAKRGARG